MTIEMYYTDKSGRCTVQHDLNFQQNTYDTIREVTFKNPSQALQGLLRETGPLPSDDDRKRKVDGLSKNKKKPFDVEKMADALTRLEEDDLLQVIQMIHDHKSDDTYIQNNIDGKCPRFRWNSRSMKVIANLSGWKLASFLWTCSLFLITSAR
jgi:transcription initiation factor IIF auxiliary subunit